MERGGRVSGYIMMQRQHTKLDGPGMVVLSALMLLFCWLLGSAAGRFIGEPEGPASHVNEMHSEDDHVRFGTPRVGMYPTAR